MKIQMISERVALAVLLPEPELTSEIRELCNIEERHHLLLNFERVDIITNSNLAQSLFLSRLLEGCNRKLILFGVQPCTKGIFMVTSCDGLFKIAENQEAALRILA